MKLCEDEIDEIGEGRWLNSVEFKGGISTPSGCVNMVRANGGGEGGWQGEMIE